MRGVNAATIAAHLPTLGLAKNTPDCRLTLVAAKRELGESDSPPAQARPVGDRVEPLSGHLRLADDLPAHAHRVLRGRRGPATDPGPPLRLRGRPRIRRGPGRGLQGRLRVLVRNDSEYFECDYCTFVPLQYLDPTGDVPVVVVAPSVLMSTHEECARAGELVMALATPQTPA